MAEVSLGFSLAIFPRAQARPRKVAAKTQGSVFVPPDSVVYTLGLTKDLCIRSVKLLAY